MRVEDIVGPCNNTPASIPDRSLSAWRSEALMGNCEMSSVGPSPHVCFLRRISYGPRVIFDVCKPRSSGPELPDQQARDSEGKSGLHLLIKTTPTSFAEGRG